MDSFCVAHVGRCVLRLKYLPTNTRRRLGLPHEQLCRVKSLPIVEVFVVDDGCKLHRDLQPISEDHVIFRRIMYDAVANHDNLYTYMSDYALDMGVVINVQDIRNMIRSWLKRAL